ncbi:TIGR03943 family protein [Nonomuraea sp. K274]|uniref:TIGR03943 family protein n=1 Tax=Nonomuraea cypriaca TaxID=1187855 RepID=A0A931EY70_9ACTN|nr:TIGR03943 family protein [Nonomuraea cypriaca]MBF8187010.1 TIGR03943 family protein [Nonomuraea cypriaca]
MGTAVNRQTQGALLLILGAVLLTISAFSTTYVNYVKPDFRPLLVGAGAVLLGLGLLSVVQGSLGRPGAHAHASRVAWLLAAPVFVMVIVAPPPLGSFAARLGDGTPAPSRTAGYGELGRGGVTFLTLGEFIGRAYAPSGSSLTGRKVRLTGFAVPSKTGWNITRMRINCCAADAMAVEVAVHGVPSPKENTWVRVTGTWIPRKGRRSDTYVPEMTASDVQPISPPVEPYE